MTFLKISAAMLLLLLVFAGSGSAQVTVDCMNPWFIDCNELDESTVDWVSIPDFSGRPGDTVWMPVYLTTADTISGFEILIKYDPSVLTPFTYPYDPGYPGDTVFLFTQLGGALQEAQDRQNQTGNTKDIFFARISEQAVDTNVIACAFNLSFGGQGGDTLGGSRMYPPIGEVIFSLPFIIDSNSVEGSTALFTYQEGNELVLIDTSAQEYWCTDCRRSNMSYDSDCEVTYLDTNQTPPVEVTDTVTCTSTLYPSTRGGVFTVTNEPPPTIVNFSASPSTVGAGDPFGLAWTVSNTDTVYITGPGVNFESTAQSGTHIAIAPGTDGSYEFKIKVVNEFSSDSTVTYLTVSGDPPPPDGDQPVITVNTSHFVDVGNTLVFTVSASDPNGDFVTLEATDLPANATFPTVTGTGSTSGTFTFTPALNQAGSVTATFRAYDGNTAAVFRTVQINIAEPAYDKLFTSSTEKSAAGGIKGKTSFLFPVNLVTTQTVYGVQFDFLFDESNFNVNNVLTTINNPEYVIYHNIGSTPGMVRVLTFGMANEPIGTDGTEILQIDMEVENGAVSGRYPVYFDNAWESISPDPNFPSLPLLADTGVIQVDMFGDVNLNLSVDIADLVSIVGHIITAYTLDQRQIDCGDVNSDASVNVFDLVAIVNSILTGSQLEGSPNLIYEDQYAKVQLDFNDLQQGESDFIIVRSDLPTDIAGVELEILYDPATVYLGRPEQGVDAQTMSINSSNNGGGKLKVLLHSSDPFGGGSISSGEVELVIIPITTNQNVESGDTTQVRLSKALLATSSASAVRVEGLDAPLPTSFKVAQNYPNPFNPRTTIDFSFGPKGQNVRLDIFNIIGQKVTTLINDFLPPGNHTVDWNATDEYGQKIASGVYLYKLQIDTESQTKKMLLLK